MAARQRIQLTDLRPNKEAHGFNPDTLLPRLQAFGYTLETMHFILQPMIREKRDPVGSMGNDSALACLSDRPRMLYDYFRQLFAQVTNPAIDSIREEIIMSLECYIGPERNLLDTSKEHAHRLLISHPILTNEELGAIKHMKCRGWKSKTIDITFPRSAGEDGMLVALDRICAEAEQAIKDGFSLVVLSDRAISKDRVPLSTLIACAGLHHHLVREAKRTRIGIVLETGEAREAHHHCLLIGYGADAINPYLAFESLWKARIEGRARSARIQRRRKGCQRLPQGRCQGHPEDHGQDGHLDVAVLQGSSDLRGVGFEGRSHRSLLYEHGQPRAGSELQSLGH